MSAAKKTKGQGFKIITLGDAAVGKTSIISRLVNEKFSSHHIATLGIDMQEKQYTINDEQLNLKIWDTAG